MNCRGLFVLILGLHGWLFTRAQCPTFSFNSISINHVTCYQGSNGSISYTNSGGTAPYTYGWSHGPTSRNVSGLTAGTYTVTATDANGCQTSRSFTINEALGAGPVTTGASVCKGNTAILSTSGAPVGGSYKWYTVSSGGTAIGGETSATFTTQTIKSTTTWYVSTVDGSGCESRRSAVTASMINPLYPVVDLDSSLIMHYTFDNNLVDSTGRNANANRFLQTLYTTDRYSKSNSAIRLTFSDQALDDYGYVDFGNPVDLQNLTDKVTISIWIRRDFAVGTTSPLINKWESGNGFYIGSIVTNPSNVERKVLWKISSTQMISDQPIPSDFSWHHIVCVYNGAELQVYQNGIFAGSTPCTGNIPATTVNMLMGRQADGLSTARFTGVMDDLRIYNRDLSADEIKALYNASMAFDNTPVCEGATINLSTVPVPGATFQWSGPGGFSSLQENPSITSATVSRTGTYSLVVTKSGCSTPVNNATVYVLALPSTTVSASGPTTFCEGNTVTLSAPSAVSWLWSTGASTRNIVVNQTGNYSVRATGSNGCANTSAPFGVTVNPANDAPSFTRGSDVVINEDASAQVMNSWASGISAGPGETTQTVSFNTSNDNNALFSAQPAINSSGDLSFTPTANASGIATVTVSIQDDGGAVCGTDRSADETFSITVNEVNDAPSFTKGGDVIISEDAPAQAVNGWAAAISAGPGEGTQTVAFVVSNDNNGLFSVQPSINSSGDLTFTPAPDVSGVATITLSLKDNGGTANGGVDESLDQTFTITINAINDTPSFTKGGDIVVNEDAPAQAIAGWITGITAGVDEASQTLNFQASNDNNALFAVQPSVNSSGDLSFTPAPDVSGVATVTLYLSDNGGTANGGVDRSPDQTFTITVNHVNDEPSFTKGSDIVIDEDAAAQYIAAWATGILAGPNEGTQLVTFEVNTDNGGLFIVGPSVNESGDLSFTPATDASGVATVTLSLKDNGGIANGGIDQSADETFTITIHAVNDAPSFTRGPDIVANEDAPQQVISAWAAGISAGPLESTQVLNFQISNDNNALFSVQPAVNVLGDLSFTPAPDVSGSAIVTLFLQDNGGTAHGGIDLSADQTFTITIDAANDAPSFVKGSDIIVEEDAPEQIVNAWATGISAGPGEGTQVVAFTVNNDNNALFTVQPFVNASGDLMFTPAPDAFGTATVTVSLQDDGGTANGGADKSAEQIFTITINNINDAPSFTTGPDIVVNEDAASYSVAWASCISAGDPGQALMFVASANNPDLFAVQPFVSASGILSFELNHDVSGSSVVTIHLQDDGGTANGGSDQSAEETFVITVNPVNDAPYVDLVNDRTIPVNSEPLVVHLTGIHAGAGEEDQQLTLEAFSDDHSLLPDPQLTPIQNGTAALTISPLAGVTGAVMITITIRDNGRTAFGGEDETSTSFMVTIEEEVQPVFLPNFFTPNSNGMNDAFRVRGAGIAEVQFRIYTIEGQEVFSTVDVIEATEDGWDGKHKGKDQPAGTYTWTLQGRYTNGQPLTNSNNRYGQVILMR